MSKLLCKTYQDFLSFKFPVFDLQKNIELFEANLDVVPYDGEHSTELQYD
ncbi:hypothetical protein B9G69_004950 [Bdellovibrio sp. SKB1291214]|nr:hypothetical protein [Bdellovibrio sp. SKB1291214]UYL09922.1 hypothetical protein B9G69_004950 [Bdellovibrio sp. SKB1291214]